MARVLAAAACLLPLQLTSSELSPIHLEERSGRAHAFVDAEGREVIFHGTNAVVKGPPWHPDHAQFSPDISMAKEDFQLMQRLGLNFLRLGVMWPGTEPVRGQYNETYLDQIDRIVAMAGEHGVYVMLDMHQDGLSEYFCGHGFPFWAVKRSEERWYNPLSKPFPAPFDRFENETCFYIEEKHQGARFPTRHACHHHHHFLSWGEGTFEAAQAYQALWDNWNGIGDAFAAVWAKIATRFKGRPEVVGFEVLNEPFVGDVYHNPLRMVPYPYPLNADRMNMQPTYDKVNAAVRAVDEDVLLFVEGVTWGNYGSGFSAAPGGPGCGNRTVVAYHYYEPPQLTVSGQVGSHVSEARRLGAAALLTETSSIWNPKRGARREGLADICDAHLQGWADWAWKPFFRAGPGDPKGASQYGVWGNPGTGRGKIWRGGAPPDYFLRDLARTYAPRVVGAHAGMRFSGATGDFELQYDVGRVDPDLATEIFLLPSRYPGGAAVSASASAGSVRVSYDGRGQWVRIYAGEGLRVGARVVVKVRRRAPQDLLV
eukprot:CAMPEP_0204603200 /NCGR_PEP_ID=MMETSP0661-20131031/57124_1 /ASSEMBLY_ACC=CAM_ASM_000606 /TAXON_ID=109239 /ORGANISM="Alexandrium margalefi, Strain AMGDE01CS-322" /LENGTH=540 /DNA_ID=CAMNT_0051614245 /DNA_START=6 /DNA_END=1628 /DNA_ORIENTATION=+